ncbi:hypothetical protein KC357_g272 [Hortaea werneckii]|nr:hypothetical protein KC357_g272 [Hortaea werneckii]
MLQDRAGIIVLREDLDFYAIPPRRDIEQPEMIEVKRAAGKALLHQDGIFSGLRKSEEPGTTEQHLIEMLTAGGFDHADTWGHRAAEPNKAVICSIALARLRTDIRGEAANSNAVGMAQKLLLFWRKPARRCWWEGIELDNRCRPCLRYITAERYWSALSAWIFHRRNGCYSAFRAAEDSYEIGPMYRNVSAHVIFYKIHHDNSAVSAIPRFALETDGRTAGLPLLQQPQRLLSEPCPPLHGLPGDTLRFGRSPLPYISGSQPLSSTTPRPFYLPALGAYRTLPVAQRVSCSRPRRALQVCTSTCAKQHAAFPRARRIAAEVVHCEKQRIVTVTGLVGLIRGAVGFAEANLANGMTFWGFDILVVAMKPWTPRKHFCKEVAFCMVEIDDENL